MNYKVTTQIEHPQHPPTGIKELYPSQAKERNNYMVIATNKSEDLPAPSLLACPKNQQKEKLQPCRRRQNLMHRRTKWIIKITNHQCHEYGSISLKTQKKPSSSSHIRVGYDLST